MKTIAQQLNVTDFPFVVKDKQGNILYEELYDGCWVKRQYDSEGNKIYYEDSTGYWWKCEYDSAGSEVYYEDFDGIIRDNRPKPDDVGVNRTERGWAGHYICSYRCKFRRNTLLSYKDINIVVSSVGLMVIDGEFEPIGVDRHFETMAFHADKNDKRYFDADVSKQVHFDSDWSISEVDADDKANEMHEAVVAEISTKLVQGYKFDASDIKYKRIDE